MNTRGSDTISQDLATARDQIRDAEHQIGPLREEVEAQKARVAQEKGAGREQAQCALEKDESIQQLKASTHARLWGLVTHLGQQGWWGSLIAQQSFYRDELLQPWLPPELFRCK